MFTELRDNKVTDMLPMAHVGDNLFMNNIVSTSSIMNTCNIIGL